MLIWNYWPVPAGGAESQCRKLVHALSKHEVDCCVLTARLSRNTPVQDQDGRSRVRRIAVLQMWLDAVLAWRAGRNKIPGRTQKKIRPADTEEVSFSSLRQSVEMLVRWINTMSFMVGATCWLFYHRKEFDVIHVHTGDWLAGYAGWVGKFLQIPVVCKASNMPALPILDRSVPFRNILDKSRLRINFVALHGAIEDELAARVFRKDQIVQIPNGVLVPEAPVTCVKGDYVLYVGNFSQGKAHKAFDVLLKAWVLVIKRLPSARLCMAGGGDATPWREMAGELGCAHAVHFAGYIKDLSQHYQKASVFVLPSRHEGMSNALLEAQAWGVPAVVSDIPGNRAVVNNGETGFVAPVGDHIRLAETILFLLENSSKRQEMRHNARERIMKNFSMAIIAQKYVDMYKSMAKFPSSGI
ncbi:glycosyltransferase family 4 protein [Desulfonatronum thiodismutans]|uniref:glycosyltransferase family 4 protein n=1 Tax=Desulfonatronum thiodismutans TaxID=159290 RepID=UPI0013770EFD|nr:glycosyltransferase family 4 protein [Desulfonatronum thiodismutans]